MIKETGAKFSYLRERKRSSQGFKRRHLSRQHAHANHGRPAIAAHKDRARISKGIARVDQVARGPGN